MDNDYLIRQKPWKALLLFSLPMIIGNLFQQTYTMVDSAVVGRYVGQEALAAVGASYALTNVFIWFAVGGSLGASVLVSRYFGAHQYAKMKTAVYTALFAFLLLSIVLGGAGLLLSRDIMAFLKTPASVLDLATEYLNVYFLGLPFLFLYNVLSAMFNALGKSRIPLYFLIFSSLFNMVLDWILVTQFGLGVSGVAWATLIAQGISALLSLCVLLITFRHLESGRAELFDKGQLWPMARIALPSILQSSTVSIGMMLVQSVVNQFGAEMLAGFSAAMRVESLCVVPMTAIGNAVSSYTAQNLGAGKPERVVAGYHAANWMDLICAVLLCLFIENLNGPLIGFFMGEHKTAAAMAVGTGYMQCMGWCFILIGIKMASDGVLRGSGDMKLFTVANLVNLTIRVSLATLLAPRYGIQMVWYAVPLGWLSNFIISYGEYRTGKWRTKMQVSR